MAGYKFAKWQWVLDNFASIDDVEVAKGQASAANQASWRGIAPFLTAIGGGTAKVLFMGDGDAEGAGVDSRYDRFIDRTIRGIRLRWPGGDGDTGPGYTPARYAVPAGGFTDDGVEVVGSSDGMIMVGYDGGLGNRSLSFAGPQGQGVSFAATRLRYLRVHYTARPEVDQSGELEVLADDIPVATINTWRAAGPYSAWLDHDFGDALPRKIVVRQVSGQPRFEGITRRTSLTGITGIDATNTGSRLVNYTHLGMDEVDRDLSDDRHWEAVAGYAPDLGIFSFGRNDMAFGEADMWRLHIREVVSRWRQVAPGAGLIFIMAPQRTMDVGVDDDRIVRFESVVREELAEAPNVTLIFESTLFAPTEGVDYSLGSPDGYLADESNKSAEGHKLLSDRIISLLFGHEPISWVDAVSSRDEAIRQAQDRLDETALRLNEAFSEIDLLTTDGMPKQIESTSMPGTTVMPKNSIWRVVDAQGNYSSIFVQQTDPEGSEWQARAITSEVIDNVDAGSLTVSGETVLKDVVADMFAARLATIIQADVGNLTVTGTSNLNDVVAERISAKIGQFVQIAATQILSGDIHATWTITAEGKIIAGDPAGRAVEMADDGITGFLVGPDGERLLAWQLSSTGDDSLLISDANGDVAVSLDSEGAITADTAEFGTEISIAGLPVVGDRFELAGESQSVIESLPWGPVARQHFTTTSPERPSDQEWGYAALGFTAKAGRSYEINGNFTMRQGTASTGFTRIRLRSRTGGPARVSSREEEQVYVHGLGRNYYQTDSVTAFYDGASASDRDVSVLFTYQGQNGSTPSISNLDMVVHDIGPTVVGGGSYSIGGAYYGTEPEPEPEPPTKRTYTTYWHATHSQTFLGNGTPESAPDLVQGYVGVVPSYGHRRSATLFAGYAYAGDEVGRSILSAIDSNTAIKKVEVYLYFNHWLQSTGGTALLSPLFEFTLPSTLPNSKINYTRSEKWKKGQGQWVAVPISWFAHGSAGDGRPNRGIILGGGTSTSAAYYGRADGHTASTSRRPRVRITYER